MELHQPCISTNVLAKKIIIVAPNVLFLIYTVTS